MTEVVVKEKKITPEEIPKEKLLWMYKTMLRIRRYEEKTAELFAAGELPGFIHLYIGEEAIAAGIMAALRPEDKITSTHRGHGHMIAKGGSMAKMMAENMGKVTGICKGKGGSMHIADFSIGELGANGIIGAGWPLGTGAALASKLLGLGYVVVCIAGDGAAEQGTFHEAVNLASIWKLPVVYFIEDNEYGMGMPSWPKPGDPRKSKNIKNLGDRGIAYGIPGVTIDGNDPIAVYEAVKAAVERARIEGIPSIIHALTCRQRGHFEGDPQLYRPKEDVEACKKRDPIPRFRKLLIEKGIATEEELKKIEEEVEKEVAEAIEFGRKSPFPDPKEAYTDIYASEPFPEV